LALSPSANERRLFSYRRLSILLRQEGEPSGLNRIYRLDCDEGFSVRKRPHLCQGARQLSLDVRRQVVVSFEVELNSRTSRRSTESS
jgi:putative transposase